MEYLLILHLNLNYIFDFFIISFLWRIVQMRMGQLQFAKCDDFSIFMFSFQIFWVWGGGGCSCTYNKLKPETNSYTCSQCMDGAIISGEILYVEAFFYGWMSLLYWFPQKNIFIKSKLGLYCRRTILYDIILLDYSQCSHLSEPFFLIWI